VTSNGEDTIGSIEPGFDVSPGRDFPDRSMQANLAPPWFSSSPDIHPDEACTFQGLAFPNSTPTRRNGNGIHLATPSQQIQAIEKFPRSPRPWCSAFWSQPARHLFRQRLSRTITPAHRSCHKNPLAFTDRSSKPGALAFFANGLLGGHLTIVVGSFFNE